MIPTLGLQDTGLYTCEADNNLGQVGSAQLNVSVLHAPKIVLDKLQVINEMNGLELILQWLLDNLHLKTLLLCANIYSTLQVC